MCPHILCRASLVLLLSAPAHAHLIRIPVGTDALLAPLDLDGGVLTGIHRGQPVTEFQNFFGDFVWGPRGGLIDQPASIALDFDRPVTSVEAWVGSLTRGIVNVELWSGPIRLTNAEVDMNFPGGSTHPQSIQITPPEPATKLVIWSHSEPSFWRAEVTFAVPEPSSAVLLCLGAVMVLCWRRARR